MPSTLSPALSRKRALSATATVSGKPMPTKPPVATVSPERSEEHTSELQSRLHLVCRLLLEKKKKPRSHLSIQHTSPFCPILSRGSSRNTMCSQTVRLSRFTLLPISEYSLSLVVRLLSLLS